MREVSATAVLSKRGVGRPAQHDGDWNSSTKIERRKSLPPPRASTQLLLADAEQAGEEDPLPILPGFLPKGQKGRMVRRPIH